MIGQAELGCKWHFAEQTGGTDIGPNDAMSQIFKKVPYEALVRESIQNSLDAVYDRTKPVEVHFSISSVNGKSYPNLFELRQHIDGCLAMYPGDDAMKKFKPMHDYLDKAYFERLSYLQVSDYNTTGMNYSKDDPNSPFYAFVRSKGVSAKSNNAAGGSFGFGKAAYFNVSRISTVFISTKVIGGSTFFEGESYLCTHKIEGKKLVDAGYYDNNDGEPISAPSMIPQRFLRDEPGTDISILGLRDEESREEIFAQIKNAVLLNFWMSILDKKLVVSIGDEVIDSDNLDDVINDMFPDFEDMKRRYINCRPYYEAVRNAGTDNKHILVQQRLPRLGNVRFYVFKSKQGTDRIQYMRSPRMLVKAQKNNSNYGFFGVFLCDDPKGNNILRTMEGPAHDEWDWKNNDYAPKEAKAAQKELNDFISGTLLDIFSAKNSVKLDIAGLEDYLYIPMNDDDDNNTDYEVTSGEATGEVQNDGTSMTTDIHQDGADQVAESAPEHNTGNVMVQTPSNMGPSSEAAAKKTVRSSSGSSSDSSNGGGSSRASNGNGSQSSAQNNIPTYSANGGEGAVPSQSDDANMPKEYSTYLDVSYRTFAYEKDGHIIHRLIIRSPREVEDSKAIIWAVGEQGDDEVKLKSSSLGVVNGSSIERLPLHNGKNVIDIQFESNMKMTLKLVAYE